ncbi:hypothetical protein KKA00_12945 [bacterium]|nr:hypothetical protein [bacterium]MBU1653123.1 hypothetical protein [bacterium]MBU1880411.1 hypothetical protein [bacterium]
MNSLNMRHRLILLAVPFLLMILLFGCAEEQIAVDTQAPPKVELSHRNPDSVLVEQGIDAVPEGDYIYLSWIPSIATDVEGYRIYRQNTDDGSDRIQIAELDKNTLEYEDHDGVLAPDQQNGLADGFEYSVSAFDEADNEGYRSDPGYYKLMLKPDLNQPLYQSDSLHLSWSYNQSLDVDYFVVKLFRQIEGDWLPFWKNVYSLFWPLTVTYYGTLAPGEYLYQVDVVGAAPFDMPMGSEEAVQFTIP